MQFDTDIILHAIPAFLFLFIIEGIFLATQSKFDTTKEILASFGLGLGYVILAPFTKGSNLLVYSFLYQHRIFDLSNHVLVAWLLCFFGDDLTYYWSHRLGHEIRFFWASHQVHHSARTLSLSTAFRQSWTNNLVGTFLFWSWLPLLGINPAMLLFVKSINVIYQFWLHTEAIKKLPGWVEFVFNTPSHHRVHHGSNTEYLDKNYGGILIIWDRIFKTYRDETITPRYGLTKNINSSNPFVITFFGWKNLIDDLRKSTSLKNAICYIFKAPVTIDVTTKPTHDLQKLQSNQKKQSAPEITVQPAA